MPEACAISSTVRPARKARLIFSASFGSKSVFRLPVPRQCDEVNLLALIMGPNTACQRIAVKSRQAQVEEANIGAKGQRSPKATGTVMRHLNLVTILREQDPEHLARVVVVLDDEHPSRLT